ncbi:MAG: hypothetical protein ACOCUR_02315 [Nanoarchaeota archaeon]
MIINIKELTNYRAVLFEDLAKMMIRKRNKNNFIFMTRRFDDLDEVVRKYNLDVSSVNHDIMQLLESNFKTIDLIEFKLNNFRERIVDDLAFYEVKTKSHNNKMLSDMCVKSYETYKVLMDEGFQVMTVFFVFFENWRCSFNMHPMDLKNFKVYSRFTPV